MITPSGLRAACEMGTVPIWQTRNSGIEALSNLNVCSHTASKWQNRATDPDSLTSGPVGHTLSQLSTGGGRGPGTSRPLAVAGDRRGPGLRAASASSTQHLVPSMLFLPPLTHVVRDPPALNQNNDLPSESFTKLAQTPVWKLTYSFLTTHRSPAACRVIWETASLSQVGSPPFLTYS